MKKMSKIFNNIYFIILFILLICFLLLTYHSIFIGKLYNSFLIKPFLVTLLAITYYFLLIKINTKIKEKKKNENNKVAIIISIISCLIMFLFSSYISIIPNRDLSNIIVEAKNLLTSNHIADEGYISTYPNQLGILFIVKHIYQLANFLHVNQNIFACFCSSISITLSLYFVYLSIKKISNKENALTFLLFLVLNPMFYLLAAFYYSDMFSISFIYIIIYLLITDIEENTFSLNKKHIIKFISIGLLSYLGYKIRAVVIFVLIAYFMKLLFQISMKDILKKIVLIMIGMLIGVGYFNYLNNINNVKINEDLKYPVTNWIMIGLNKDSSGKWNQEDSELISKTKTKDEKKDVTITNIKDRVNKLGFVGLIKLQNQKLKYNCAYGDSPYSTYYFHVTNYNKLYEYIVGNKKVIISYILQVNRVLLYILLIKSALIEMKNKKRNINFIFILIFGAFLFYSIWEVYPRYSFCFIPLLTLAAAINFNKSDKENVEKNKIIKILQLLLILATIFIFVSNYKLYTKEKTIKKETVANSIVYNQKNIFYIDKDTEFKQYFKTSLKFNSIVIKVDKNNNIEGKLYFKIYDDKNNIIYESNKKIIEIKDKIELNLPKRYNTKGQYYYLSITSDSKENFGIYGIYKDKLDYLPMGYLKINDKDEKLNLQININNIVEKSILSKKIYLFFTILVLIIQIYSFNLINKKCK